MVERLQKVLAHRGIASRRHAEQMITAGRVRVNGQTAILGQKVDPNSDRIEWDGNELLGNPPPPDLYLLMHKPAGVVTTCHDPQGRPTVLDLISADYKQGTGLHPVGRLDAESTGALLLTNDGQVTFHLTHPKHHIAKTYRVVVQGSPSPEILHQWRCGILLNGRLTLPAMVRIHKPFSRQHQTTTLEIVLREGRNRQIRRVAKILGHPVVSLHRIQIGAISLYDSVGRELPVGQVRSLTPAEVLSLQNIIERSE
jgi:23S rRNA pseudouridine2605 synthase